MDVVILKMNARGALCGESQPMCRHSDATVERARAMFIAGYSYQQIADALGVPHAKTVWRWCNGARRPHDKVQVARRNAATTRTSVIGQHG